MQKPKRKPLRISSNPIATAMLRASRLTDGEVAQIINPLRMAIDKMRRCCADHDDYVLACSAVRAAQAIERSRIVRGLADEIAAAERALWCINARAERGEPAGGWRQKALYADELEALRMLAQLHEYQLRQLSSGEIERIIKTLIAQVQSAGGVVEMREAA